MLDRIPAWSRAAAAGALVATVFQSLHQVRVHWFVLSLHCDGQRDPNCLGTAFVDLMLSVVLFVLAMCASAVALGWALLTLLRVRQALLVAALGPALVFGLAVTATALGGQRLYDSPPLLIGGSTLAYALVGLVLARSPAG
jgi:hypothetical protein